jgi:hypothetical protein
MARVRNASLARNVRHIDHVAARLPWPLKGALKRCARWDMSYLGTALFYVVPWLAAVAWLVASAVHALRQGAAKADKAD